MKKPTRKPAVRQEMRRRWFQRYEEDGESALHIAETDGYDVRTFRPSKRLNVRREKLKHWCCVMLWRSITPTFALSQRSWNHSSEAREICWQH